MEEAVFKCVCMVCSHVWFFVGVPEARIRCSCSPCGHQGLFDVFESTLEEKEEHDQTKAAKS